MWHSRVVLSAMTMSSRPATSTIWQCASQESACSIINYRKNNSSCIIVYAHYACFSTKARTNMNMAREHSTSLSQVRCHDIRVVAPHTFVCTLPSRKTHLQLIASQYHTGAVHFSPYLHLCV